ncbi:hypothetical protein [Nocardia sp. MW-W600-9]
MDPIVIVSYINAGLALLSNGLALAKQRAEFGPASALTPAL